MLLRTLLDAGRGAIAGVVSWLEALAHRLTTLLPPPAAARQATPVPARGALPRAPVIEPAPPPPPLAAAYGADRIVVLPRDPWWLFAYWEITPRTRIDTLRALGPDATGALAVLRLYADAGTPHERPELDIELVPGADRWYVELPRPGGRWAVAIGLRLHGARFVPLVRSAAIEAPPAQAAPEPVEAVVEWVTVTAPSGETPLAPPVERDTIAVVSEDVAVPALHVEPEPPLARTAVTPPPDEAREPPPAVVVEVEMPPPLVHALAEEVAPEPPSGPAVTSAFPTPGSPGAHHGRRHG